MPRIGVAAMVFAIRGIRFVRGIRGSGRRLFAWRKLFEPNLGSRARPAAARSAWYSADTNLAH